MRDLPGAMALIHWVRKNWPEMDKIERLTVVEQYLEPMDGGSSKTIYDGEGYYTLVEEHDQGIFEQVPGYPYNWIWEVTKTRKSYGAAWSVAKGSAFRYEPKLTPLNREEMELPKREEEVEKQAGDVAGMFEGKQDLVKKVIRETIRRKLENMLK